jgi:hypothetical protein
MMVAASSLRRHKTTHGRGRMGQIMLSELHPASRSGRTIFASRVFDPAEVQRVLKTGHQSRKIGKVVTKGARRGWPIFTLTLEERATCPRTCKAWAMCFGNNMQAAERIVAGPELEVALWRELIALQRQHPRGFMIRLHVLGDFYSLGYVRLWKRALAEFPALHVFGFTARDRDQDPIGALLWRMANADWGRFAMRFSGLDAPMLGSQLMPDQHAAAIPCPAQRRDEICCASCMLCIHSKRSIAFARH